MRAAGVVLVFCLAALGCDGDPMTGEDSGPACDRSGLFCTADEYCARPPDCRGPGFCNPRPTVCSTDGPEVCGCDGVTYANECEANAAGTSVNEGATCE